MNKQKFTVMIAIPSILIAIAYYLVTNGIEKDREDVAACVETDFRVHTKSGWTVIYDCKEKK